MKGSVNNAGLVKLTACCSFWFEVADFFTVLVNKICETQTRELPKALLNNCVSKERWKLCAGSLSSAVRLLFDHRMDHGGTDL